MQHRSLVRRRGLTVAAIALTLSIAAPGLASAAVAGARSSRSELRSRPSTYPQLEAKQKKKKAALLPGHIVTPATRRQTIHNYLVSHPAAAARLKATLAKRGAAKATAKKKAISRSLAARKARAKRARVLRARRLAATRAKARRVAAGAATGTAAGKKKTSSLSLPILALLALAPFVLMGAYLLAADSLRRRPPRKRHASLVITRVGGR